MNDASVDVLFSVCFAHLFIHNSTHISRNEVSLLYKVPSGMLQIQVDLFVHLYVLMVHLTPAPAAAR